MEKHNNGKLVKVIFRKLDGEIIAMFPQLPGDNNWQDTCLSYAHNGQHGTAQAVALGKPAKPEEYAELKKELESIGYRLRVDKRMTQRDMSIRCMIVNRPLND